MSGFDVEEAREIMMLQVGHALADLTVPLMESLESACDEVERLRARLGIAAVALGRIADMGPVGGVVDGEQAIAQEALSRMRELAEATT